MPRPTRRMSKRPEKLHTAWWHTHACQKWPGGHLHLVRHSRVAMRPVRHGNRETAGGPPWSAPQGARGGGRFCRQGHALATSDVHGFPLGHRRPEKQEEEEEEEEGGKGRRWRRRKTGRLSPSENSPLRRAERVPPFAATAAPEKQRDGATASCARACRHDREDAPLESTSAPHGEAGAA
ncbi:unnamed protein product [Prorocentrum cordatum]|uniref:Uncharacterized protein n=1 Tax=Prorocentrum cordatum TaxID=2364126 RepID=A0ABN9WQ65_9DINO|nr:unnamed protein product [Polarella glacialis]